MKYRKKPVVIEAVQFLGNLDSMIDFMGPVGVNFHVVSWDEFENPSELAIHTLEGNHIALPTEFIIKGIKGEYYSCKPDIFEATYEKVND